MGFVSQPANIPANHCSSDELQCLHLVFACINLCHWDFIFDSSASQIQKEQVDATHVMFSFHTSSAQLFVYEIKYRYLQPFYSKFRNLEPKIEGQACRDQSGMVYELNKFSFDIATQGLLCLTGMIGVCWVQIYSPYVKSCLIFW